MPLYDYKCSVCRRGRSVFLKIAELNSSVFCQSCGHAMNRQISAPYVRGDYPGYE
jgi:putative FmdB family regulatory protein